MKNPGPFGMYCDTNPPSLCCALTRVVIGRTANAATAEKGMRLIHRPFQLCDQEFGVVFQQQGVSHMNVTLEQSIPEEREMCVLSPAVENLAPDNDEPELV
jgi:hypothetical protein